MATRAVAGGAFGATAAYVLSNKTAHAIVNPQEIDVAQGGWYESMPQLHLLNWFGIPYADSKITTTCGKEDGPPIYGGMHSLSDMARAHVGAAGNKWNHCREMNKQVAGRSASAHWGGTQNLSGGQGYNPATQRQYFRKRGSDGSASAGGGDLDYPPNGLSANVRALPEWIQLGCGDKPYYCTEKDSTFGCDHRSPTAMPDLSKHNNFMAEFLRENPDVYHKYKNLKTKMGVTFADCIKTGVDNKGHPFIKTVGATAGDEESYELFKDFFYPVTAARHPGYDPRTMTQPTNMDLNQLSDTDIDPECKYVLTTRVRTGRSVRNFRLPPSLTFQERRDLEALVVKGLLNMSGDLKGDYYPLHGSRSYPPKPNGMSEAKEDELRKMGNLFQEPDSTLLLASGMGRHWPDARGVFHNDAKNLFVWVNEEDHLRIVSMQGSRANPTHEGKQIKEVTARFMRACTEVQKVLKAEGSDFMHNPRLGWVLTCPSNLGTGLRAGTMVKLPLLSARSDWKKLLGKMSLQCRGTGGVDSASTGGTWDVSNSDRIGKGEVDLVNVLIEGAAQLVKWEKLLEAGDKATVDAQIAAKMA